MTDEKLYTTQEVADLVGVSSRTIQLWAAAGVINAWKTPGGHRRFPGEEVQRLQRELGSDASGGRQTILVVEDEPDLQMLYRLSIESWNLPVEIVTAQDGYEGLLQIGLRKPEVIILDLMMPKTDGFRVLEVMESSGELRNSLVMVVSGMSPEEIRDKVELPETVAIYPKPIPFGMIRERVIAHLRGR